MLSTYIAILLSAAISGSITDAQLVGTWQPSGKTVLPPHGVGTISYHADHTCTHKGYSEEGASFAYGTWRLRGRELITRFGKEIVVRETILSVSPNRFSTRARDGAIFIYTRVKPERPSASNQAMERTATRRAFTFPVAWTSSLRPALALGGRRSSCSR